MSESPYLFDVTADDFSEQVLQRSKQVPVLVDFWADWCGPCRMLAPILDNLAQAYQGKLLVAKVNSDKEQTLATQYQIRSLPTVKLFRDGEVVDEFMGVQPESAIRDLLENHIPRASDTLRENAKATEQSGHQEKALELLQQAHHEDPENYRVHMDLADLLIQLDRVSEAEELLRSLPAKFIDDEKIKRLLAKCQLASTIANAPPINVLRTQIQAHPENLALREQLAARCILAEDYEAGMDEYLEIMKRDRRFNDEAGHRGLMATFDLLGDDERVAPYRRKLFNFLH